jgi:hypothetical protein
VDNATVAHRLARNSVSFVKSRSAHRWLRLPTLIRTAEPRLERALHRCLDVSKRISARYLRSTAATLRRMVFFGSSRYLDHVEARGSPWALHPLHDHSRTPSRFFSPAQLRLSRAFCFAAPGSNRSRPWKPFRILSGNSGCGWLQGKTPAIRESSYRRCLRLYA